MRTVVVCAIASANVVEAAFVSRQSLQSDLTSFAVLLLEVLVCSLNSLRSCLFPIAPIVVYGITEDGYINTRMLPMLVAVVVVVGTAVDGMLAVVVEAIVVRSFVCCAVVATNVVEAAFFFRKTL